MKWELFYVLCCCVFFWGGGEAGVASSVAGKYATPTALFQAQRRGLK